LAAAGSTATDKDAATSNARCQDQSSNYSTATEDAASSWAIRDGQLGRWTAGLLIRVATKLVEHYPPLQQ
jgi:hypothetical protein